MGSTEATDAVLHVARTRSAARRSNRNTILHSPSPSANGSSVESFCEKRNQVIILTWLPPPVAAAKLVKGIAGMMIRTNG